jgi:hypothetical protein
LPVDSIYYNHFNARKAGEAHLKWFRGESKRIIQPSCELVAVQEIFVFGSGGGIRQNPGKIDFSGSEVERGF